MPRSRKQRDQSTHTEQTEQTAEARTSGADDARRDGWGQRAADTGHAGGVTDERPGSDGPIDAVEEATFLGPTPGDDELERLRAQAADYEDRWKRSTAEFINYKRRTEQERADSLRYANRDLIVALLPVLDDLERALAHVPAEQAESEWVKGVRLVERKFRTILERQGVTPIEAVGQPFDPALHEAVAGSGTVVTQEYQRGYRMHDRVLRPSMVVVGEAEPVMQ